MFFKQQAIEESPANNTDNKYKYVQHLFQPPFQRIYTHIRITYFIVTCVLKIKKKERVLVWTQSFDE